jgi:hypothetical protein
MFSLPVVMFAAPRLHLEIPRPLLQAAAFTWLAVFAVTGFRHQYFRCPRCGKPFFLGAWSNVFASRCLHCKLPKWATRDPAFDIDRNLD